MKMQDKGIIHISGKTKLDSVRFHHATQSGPQFKAYELLISGISHLIFSHCGSLQITETGKSETADKGGLPYFLTCNL